MMVQLNWNILQNGSLCGRCQASAPAVRERVSTDSDRPRHREHRLSGNLASHSTSFAKQALSLAPSQGEPYLALVRTTDRYARLARKK